MSSSGGVVRCSIGAIERHAGALVPARRHCYGPVSIPDECNSRRNLLLSEGGRRGPLVLTFPRAQRPSGSHPANVAWKMDTPLVRPLRKKADNRWAIARPISRVFPKSPRWKPFAITGYGRVANTDIWVHDLARHVRQGSPVLPFHGMSLPSGRITRQFDFLQFSGRSGNTTSSLIDAGGARH